jgi:hypothetical protein
MGPSKPNKHDKLVSWALSHGARIPDSLTFYGHCRTSVPLERDTTLFRLPRSILITPDVARNALPQLNDASVHERMCVFIALEQGKQGFWKDYLDSLPRHFTTPAYFREIDLDVFEGTNLAILWEIRTAKWKDEFDHAKRLVKGLQWYFFQLAALIQGRFCVGCNGTLITFVSRPIIDQHYNRRCGNFWPCVP